MGRSTNPTLAGDSRSLALLLAGVAAACFWAGVQTSRRDEPRRTDQPPVVAERAVDTPAGPAGAYQAQVVRVLDGDTLEVRVSVWIGQEILTRVRLRGVDAPELAGACAGERAAAAAARERLAALVAAGSVTVVNPGADKYFGRVVAGIKAHDGRDLAATLLAEGMVRPYAGGRRSAWCM